MKKILALAIILATVSSIIGIMFIQQDVSDLDISCQDVKISQPVPLARYQMLLDGEPYVNATVDLENLNFTEIVGELIYYRGERVILAPRDMIGSTGFNLYNRSKNTEGYSCEVDGDTMQISFPEAGEAFTFEISLKLGIVTSMHVDLYYEDFPYSSLDVVLLEVPPIHGGNIAFNATIPPSG